MHRPASLLKSFHCLREISVEVDPTVRSWRISVEVVDNTWHLIAVALGWDKAQGDAGESEGTPMELFGKSKYSLESGRRSNQCCRNQPLTVALWTEMEALVRLHNSNLFVLRHIEICTRQL